MTSYALPSHNTCLPTVIILMITACFLQDDKEKNELDRNTLKSDMRESGLHLKTLASMATGIYGAAQNPFADNQRLIPNDEDRVAVPCTSGKKKSAASSDNPYEGFNGDELKLLKALSTKEKLKLLKRLKKMDKAEKNKNKTGDDKKKKSSVHGKKRKRSKKDDSSSSGRICPCECDRVL